jgi:hypothetical protein
VTQIPLETSSRQESSVHSNDRPPWIRPVPKKPPSITAPRSSNGSAESEHSSPEAFTPNEFFVDVTGGGASPHPSSNTAATSSTPTASQSSPPQSFHSVPHNPFMDTSGLGMNMDIMRPDPSLFMSPAEVMALFNDGGVDVASLFPTDFIHQQHQNSPEQQNGIFGGPFRKHSGGLVTSP